jgi:hypothetical protein
MTARIVWKQQENLRGIEKRARETADPVERLRYVRKEMDSRELPEESRWRPVRRIAAAIAVAIGTALLVWRIH